MRLFNAEKGILRLFIAEIITVITSALGIVINVLSQFTDIFGENAAHAHGESGSVIYMGFSSIISLLGIVGFVIEVLGLISLKKDEKYYKKIFALFLIIIVLSVFPSVVGAMTESTAVVDILIIVVMVLVVLKYLLAFRGLSVLSARTGNDELSQTIGKNMKIATVFFALGFVFLIAATFSPSFSENEAVGNILHEIYSVLDVAGIISYILTLAKAKTYELNVVKKG